MHCIVPMSIWRVVIACATNGVAMGFRWLNPRRLHHDR